MIKMKICIQNFRFLPEKVLNEKHGITEIILLGIACSFILPSTLIMSVVTLNVDVPYYVLGPDISSNIVIKFVRYILVFSGTLSGFLFIFAGFRGVFPNQSVMHFISWFE